MRISENTGSRNKSILFAVLFLLITGAVCLRGTFPAEAASVYLNENKLIVCSGEEFTLKLYGVKNASEYWVNVYSAQSYGTEWQSEVSYAFDITLVGEGKYRFSTGSYDSGEYIIEISGVSGTGRTYSDTCEVSVLRCGLTESGMTVSIGQTKQIGIENARITQIIRTYNDYWWWYSEPSGEAEIASDGTVTGILPGMIYLNIIYVTDSGQENSASYEIEVTDPEYIPFEGYLRAGESYSVRFNGAGSRSEISLSCDKEDMCTFPEWSAGSFTPLKDGTFTLTVNIDGRTFTQELQVLDLRLQADMVLLRKGKTKKIGIKNLPEDLTVTYQTSNKKVATVTRFGKIKAKREGSAVITATVSDGTVLLCTVNVGKGTAFNAAVKGAGHIGDLYSQGNRMKDGYEDCSSLAWKVYHEACYDIGSKTYAPTAAELGRQLESEGKVVGYGFVDPDELQPGDMIFYSSTSNGRYKNIDHVSVYYGAKYGYDWWSDDYTNSGVIVHAISPTVCFSNYSSYCTRYIVMVCRPTMEIKTEPETDDSAVPDGSAAGNDAGSSEADNGTGSGDADNSTAADSGTGTGGLAEPVG